MVIKTATYTGMNLKGEIRESISLDEDDLSDVEDEVFIRDGKNGYKLAEELNVKRPLMAPRRRHGKYDSRLKPRPNYKTWCKPFCYILTSLSILIGLIALVVVIIEIYPISVSKFKEWISAKSSSRSTKTPPNNSIFLPCTNLNVTDIWAMNFPGFSSESPIRVLDINGDEIEDVIFGFSTGDNSNLFPSDDEFCRIFLGVNPPCDGGLIALNGKNGEIIWKNWMNDSIFSLHCNADVNFDNLNDCLIAGVSGTIGIIDGKTGKNIWKFHTGKMNIFVTNFIHDQNNDNISDVVASHSSLDDKFEGHIVLFSGKNGEEIRKIGMPNSGKTFFMPQILERNNKSSSSYLIYGTGTPNTAGNLSAIPLNDLNNLKNKSSILYEDKFKGIFISPVLVDITGDSVPDIVAATYNSTIIAINGKTFEKIWNYFIPNAVTDLSPTPAFFNSDNVTDFLVIYQKYESVFNHNYTETFIIDGLTGKPIYQPINDGIITQMNGLTLSMEGKGYDLFLFWTSECLNTETHLNEDLVKNRFKFTDQCKLRYNSSSVLKLNALNQFHQPPGLNIYNSEFRFYFEYNSSKSVMELLREYFKDHPNEINNGQSEIARLFPGNSGKIGIKKYGQSSFRHKDRPSSGLVKDEFPNSNNNNNNAENSEDYNNWMPSSSQDDFDSEFSNYNIEDDNIPYNQKKMLFNGLDPNKLEEENHQDNQKLKKSKKKNLAEKIFGYPNVRSAKQRLLQDEDALPTDILKENYFKNEEKRLRKMKFEQRDVNSHLVGKMDNLEIQKIIENQKNEATSAVKNQSITLWDIESENELQERDDKGFFRKKRDLNPENSAKLWNSIQKITSVGAILSSFNVSKNANTVDIVFIKYWLPLDFNLDDIINLDLKKCSASSKKTEKECLNEQENVRTNFGFYSQIPDIKFAHLTVYRLRIRCDCDSSFNKDIPGKCAKFLPKNFQAWPEYLGRNGDGIFKN